MILVSGREPSYPQTYEETFNELSLPKSPNLNRRGRIRFEAVIIESELFLEILAHMELVVLDSKNRCYIGFSPMFRELEQSEHTPNYDALIKLIREPGTKEGSRLNLDLEGFKIIESITDAGI
jgi:hypothetical protein